MKKYSYGYDKHAIDLWCGVSEKIWNYHPVNPGPLVCIAPTYGKSAATKKETPIKIPPHVLVRLDCSAFSDALSERLSPPAALTRQLTHADKYNYYNQIDTVASYDMLIDEKWEDGKRYKRRWSENDAWAAVEVTINAAKYLSKHYAGRRVLSAQGVTASQYLNCATRVMEWFDTETDVFGLGGWCIAGKMPKQIRPSFNRVVLSVIPFIAEAGVKEVHIWGVMDVTFLGPLLWLCDQHKIKLATDSVGPQLRPTMGLWGYRGWSNHNYKRPEVKVRGVHRAVHVQLVRCWLSTLRQTKFYHHPYSPDTEFYNYPSQYLIPT